MSLQNLLYKTVKGAVTGAVVGIVGALSKGIPPTAPALIGAGISGALHAAFNIWEQVTGIGATSQANIEIKEDGN